MRGIMDLMTLGCLLHYRRRPAGAPGWSASFPA